MALNPQKALSAALPPAIDVSGGAYSVKPITLGIFALLERYRSPMLFPQAGKAIQTLDLLPSLYILTHDVADSLSGNILDKALEWADTVGVNALGEIRDAAQRQLTAIADIMPDDIKKKNATQTDVSPTGSTGAQAITAGTGRPSCSASRSRRSRSAGARGDARSAKTI
jgi:hypothetical protein